jgi:hypothetical protein
MNARQALGVLAFAIRLFFIVWKKTLQKAGCAGSLLLIIYD